MQMASTHMTTAVFTPNTWAAELPHLWAWAHLGRVSGGAATRADARGTHWGPGSREGAIPQRV